MVDNKFANDRVKAVDLGNGMLQVGLMWHVTHDHTFKDKSLFYAVKAFDEEAIVARGAGGGRELQPTLAHHHAGHPNASTNGPPKI